MDTQNFSVVINVTATQMNLVQIYTRYQANVFN